MAFATDGRRILDEQGRERFVHGINLVDKGPADATGAHRAEDFRGAWTGQDLAHLRELGLDTLRLGVIWAALEPQPGRLQEEYLDWIGEQLDLAHEHGLRVVLDAHQDLYSQAWSDGAPVWATLTEQPFEATDYWSDAYLASPAVHEALDAFWANAPAEDGVGLQDHLAACWGELARRFGDHPAVIGYDVLNEPAPGGAAGELFGGVLMAFAEATGQEVEQLAADFEDPERKLAQLAHLDDVAVHRAIGDALAEPMAAVEQAVDGLFQRVLPAIRAHDATGLVLREHNYFGNLGIPCAIPPLQDAAWVYSPHGYDLLVDTDAMHLSSDTRVTTIFERAAENADRLDVPVLVGEWGAFDDREGIASHCRAQLDLFESKGWGWLYWVWTPGLRGSEAAAELRRPRPRAIAGSAVRYGRALASTVPSADGSAPGWAASWQGDPALAAPSELFVPAEQQVRLLIGGQDRTSDLRRDGDLVTVPAGPGEHLLLVD